MDNIRVYKKIDRLSGWFRPSNITLWAERREILKPLNKLIDFDNQECINEIDL
ncbi:MAG: hypothetical protein ACFFD2_03940 [Promethearchaeota archaeon]